MRPRVLHDPNQFPEQQAREGFPPDLARADAAHPPDLASAAVHWRCRMMASAQIAQHRPFEGAECLLPIPGAFAASADGLSGWALNAGPGRMCVYARAERAPRGVGAKAHHLMLQGLVTLRRSRHAPGGPLFDFAAVRTDLSIAKAKPVPIDASLPLEARQLFDVLVQLADAGKACPGNDQLAALIGVRGSSAVSKHLARLDAANLIEVHWLERFVGRQIEILETGAKTGKGL